MQKKKRLRVSSKVKLSNRLRFNLIVLSVIIIAAGTGNLVKSYMDRTKTILNNRQIYQYTNKFKSDSNINLKKNEYVNENEMIDGQAYLSDLISNINMHMNYRYDSINKSDVTYNYKIEAIVKSTYTNNQDSYDILNKNEVIKDVGDNTVSSDELEINEDFSVDYEKYHKIIKDFKQTIGINADSKLLIQLTVNTKTTINSQEVNNKYVSKYSITLGDKIAVVEENNNDEKSESISREEKLERKTEIDIKGILINSIVTLIGIIILKLTLTKTEELMPIKNEFKLELNKILKSYEDKIVQIQDMDNIDIEHATRVKDIIQLRKLAEESLMPIYCYVSDDERKAYFIVTKYKNNYIYILR